MFASVCVCRVSSEPTPKLHLMEDLEDQTCFIQLTTNPQSNSETDLSD